MPIRIVRLTDPVKVGKAVYWNGKRNCVYFTSYTDSELHKYDVETGKHTYAKIGDEPVTLVIPSENTKNEYLIAYGRRLARVEWDGISRKAIILQTLNYVDQRDDFIITGGKLSPSGVLFVGTRIFYDALACPPCGLLVAVYDGKNKILLDNLKTPNGIAWSVDETRLYIADTAASEIYSFDYDAKNIEVSNRNVIFNFKVKNVEGFPDGLTVDSNDYLWVACMTLGQILQIDPKMGKLLRNVTLPVHEIVSIVFGGAKLNELYVTTGRVFVPREDEDKDSHSGSLYKICGIGAKKSRSSNSVRRS